MLRYRRREDNQVPLVHNSWLCFNANIFIGNLERWDLLRDSLSGNKSQFLELSIVNHHCHFICTHLSLITYFSFSDLLLFSPFLTN
jgi:hypothetical protein